MCTSSSAVEVDVRRHGKGQHPRGPDRKFRSFRLRYQLEQSYRYVSTEIDYFDRFLS